MKNPSAALRAALADYAGSPAYCILLTAKNGAEYRLTSYFQSVTLNGAIYHPFLSPMNASEKTQTEVYVKISADVSLQREEEAIFALAENHIIADKLLQTADVSVFLTVFTGGDQSGLKLFSGKVKQILSDGDLRTVHCVSDKSNLRRVSARSVNKICSAVWGDATCGVDRSAFAVSLTVSAIVNDYSFAFTVLNGNVPLKSPAPYLEIDGRRVPIVTVDKMRNVIITAEAVTLVSGQNLIYYPGCDGSFASCKLFANSVNFRGFPFTPEKDKILRF